MPPINDAMSPCRPLTFFTDQRLSTLEDRNGDGFICFPEAHDWVQSRYESDVNKLYGEVFSQCESFDREAALVKLKALRKKTSQDIQVLSRVFKNPDGTIEKDIGYSIGRSISLFEKSVTEVFTLTESMGTGKVGIRWRVATGEITSVRPKSAGNKVGLRVGDVLVSANGVLRNSENFQKQLFGPCGENVSLRIMRYDQIMEIDVVKGAY